MGRRFVRWFGRGWWEVGAMSAGLLAVGVALGVAAAGVREVAAPRPPSRGIGPIGMVRRVDATPVPRPTDVVDGNQFVWRDGYYVWRGQRWRCGVGPDAGRCL